jgi:DNA-binding MarR family transcriptional regulator
MGDAKGNIDFFGSYLSRLSDPPSTEQSKGASPSGPPEMAILKALLISSGPVAIKALMPIIRLAPSLLMKTLDSLEEARLVEVSRTETDECVSITDLGRRIAG